MEFEETDQKQQEQDEAEINAISEVGNRVTPLSRSRAVSKVMTRPSHVPYNQVLKPINNRVTSRRHELWQ